MHYYLLVTSCHKSTGDIRLIVINQLDFNANNYNLHRKNIENVKN